MRSLRKMFDGFRGRGDHTPAKHEPMHEPAHYEPKVPEVCRFPVLDGSPQGDPLTYPLIIFDPGHSVTLTPTTFWE